MDIGESIRKLRESKDLTQEQLGRIAGVSSMAVSQWENGRAVPRMGAIQRIADFFGIPKSEIMGDEPRVEVITIETILDSEEPIFELVEVCTKLNDQQIQILLSTARNFAVANEKNGAGNSEDVGRAESAVIRGELS